MRRISQLLALLVIAIFIIPLFLPNRIEVETEKEFNLPADLLYEAFVNLSEFSVWEPWSANDSLAVKEFYSPYRGKGAGYILSAKKYSGEFEITQAKKEEFVDYALKGLGLGKESHMRVEFISESADSTKVVWKIDSKKISYFSRYFSYFTSHKLEELLETGWENLEEKLTTAPLSEDQLKSLGEGNISVERFEGRKVLAVENNSSHDSSEIETAIAESLGYLRSYLKDFLDIPDDEIGNAIVYFESDDPATGLIRFYCGYALSGSAAPDEGMVLKSIPAGENLVSVFQGGLEGVDEVKNKITAYADENDYNLDNVFWVELPEDYVPGTGVNSLSLIRIPLKN